MDLNKWSNPDFPFLTQRPIVNNWYRIRRSDLSSETLQEHKSKLSIRSCIPNYVTEKYPEPTLCFLEEGEDFCVPYNYGIRNFGQDFQDDRNTGLIDTRRSFQYKGPALDEEILNQLSAKEAMMKALTSVYGTALLALPMGTGKTTVMLNVYAELCKYVGGTFPLLVLVHKDFLLDQWIERIKECLTEVKIGIMRGTVLDYDGKDIVLCTIQSLIKDVKGSSEGEKIPRYGSHIMRYFGMVIIDEAHHISAKKFCRCFPLTSMRRISLLTGTPFRKDKAQGVAESWTGGVTFQTKRIYTRDVFVHFIPINIEFETRLNFKKKLDYNMMMSDHCKCQERNQIIVKSLIPFVKARRQILVLSHRCEKIKHLDMLQEELLNLCNQLQIADVKTSLFYGKTKKKDRKHAFMSQVIFSTFDMAEEALDLPSISVVSLSTQDKDVAQAIARCIRGKYQLFDPVILDYNDTHRMWKSYAMKRTKYYKEEGFFVVRVDNETWQNYENIEIDDYNSKKKEENKTSFNKKRKNSEFNDSVESKFQKLEECPL